MSSSNLPKLAQALADNFSSPTPGAPLTVFEGEAELVVADKILRGTAEVAYNWYPRPRFCICFQPVDGASGYCVPFGKATVRTDQGGTFGFDVTHISGVVEGDAFGDIFGQSVEVSKVYFYLPNFLDHLGEPIGSKGGGRWLGRCNMQSDEWKITLDKIIEGKPHDFLKTTSGYAVTHIGMAERVDGKMITMSQVDELREQLFWYLSFCRGKWTGPALLTGRMQTEADEWVSLYSPKVSIWSNVNSWCRYRDEKTIAGGFRGCSALLQSPTLREALTLGIHWYVEANMCGGGIEGALVLAQAALEMLAWHWLVAENKFCSDSGFKNIPAEDKIRLLLSFCNIPIELPESLPQLQSHAKELNWSTGPTAITQIRNGLAHGTPSLLAKEFSRPAESRYEAWNLSLWYLELVLLRLMGFDGEYFSRIDPPKNAWDPGHTVPWHRPVAADERQLASE